MTSKAFLFAAALAAATASVPANAADMSAPAPIAIPAPVSGWTFQLTPYMWAAGIQGPVALGPNVPQVNLDTSFGQIISHLKMAAMGSFEAHYGPLGFIGDITYLRLGVSAKGPVGFIDGSLDDRTFLGTFLATYRVIDQGPVLFDITGGGRAWALQNQLDITGPGGIGISASQSKSWVDPVVGLRARANLTRELFLQFDGDVGGWGVASKSTWQVQGIMGYQYSPSTSMFFGWRTLSVDYRRDGFVWDVMLSGPIVGASFKF